MKLYWDEILALWYAKENGYGVRGYVGNKNKS